MRAASIAVSTSPIELVRIASASGFKRRWIAVDDHESGSMSLCGSRQVGGRRNDERRADRQHEIGLARPAVRFHQHIGRQHLAERDRGVLEPAAALGAIGHAILGEELFDERADLVAGSAIEAGGLAGGAVKFQHAAAAGHLVQAIDVLGDHAADPAGGFPAGQHLVAGVGLGVGELAMHFALLPPVFVAGIGAFEEFVEIDGAILRPDATGRAKVGDAAFGADAGAGQDNGGFSISEPTGHFFDAHCHVNHGFLQGFAGWRI